jgi:hypothetical protein
MRRRFSVLGYVSRLRHGVSERRPLAGSGGEVPASFDMLAEVAGLGGAARLVELKRKLSLTSINGIDK